MSCFHPLKAYLSKRENASGKRSLVFSIDEAISPVEFSLPCCKCIGCRVDRSLMWAVRCVHEASMHPCNCFITLTYDDEHLPKDGRLVRRDLQLFMKRFRKAIYPTKIRFFACGEYGSDKARPHFHACIFGYDFPDKILFRRRGDVNLYISPTLQTLWGLGYSTVGDVTFRSAAYIARYVLKKWVDEGLSGEELYEAMVSFDDSVAANEVSRPPEFIAMSLRPAIGKDWFLKYHDDIVRTGHCVIDGHPVKVPDFYLKEWAKMDDFGFTLARQKSVDYFLANPKKSASLQLGERKLKAKVKQLKREVEG